MEKVTWKKICTLVIGAILLFWGLQHIEWIIKALRGVLHTFSPFILGGAIAFIFNVPMTAIERHLPFQKNRRAAAYGITLIMLVGVITFCMFVIIPQVSKTIQLIASQVPAAIETAEKMLEKLPFPEMQQLIEQWNIDWSQLTQKAVAILQSSATGIVNSGITVVGGIIKGISSFVIGFVFSVYVLLQKERLSGQLKKILIALLPEKRAMQIWRVGEMSNQIFSRFISGQCTEALILGGMFFVAMVILQIPYPLVISILIAITALVPIVGAFIGCILGALLIIIVSPVKALVFVILFLVLQQLEGNLVYPHVVGNSVGLPSIWVLVAVTIGGSLMGIAGMLIFIPLCSVVYVLAREFIQKRLQQKKLRETAQEEEA